MNLCHICRGRGEVQAGITYGQDYGPMDCKGIRSRFAIAVEINPAAWDKRHKTIWFLDYNPIVPLWSVAVCMGCGGTGTVPNWHKEQT